MKRCICFPLHTVTKNGRLQLKGRDFFCSARLRAHWCTYLLFYCTAMLGTGNLQYKVFPALMHSKVPVLLNKCIAWIKLSKWCPFELDNSSSKLFFRQSSSNYIFSRTDLHTEFNHIKENWSSDMINGSFLS